MHCTYKAAQHCQACGSEHTHFRAVRKHIISIFPSCQCYRGRNTAHCRWVFFISAAQKANNQLNLGFRGNLQIHPKYNAVVLSLSCIS